MVDTIAVVALVEDGRVLLGHRHPARRWYPDCWDLVGGHVEPGESPEQAARRECREEAGVDVPGLQPVPVRIDDTTLLVHVFVCRRWRGEPVNVAPDEHDALRWFTSAELPHLHLAHDAYRPWLADLLEGGSLGSLLGSADQA